MIVELLGDAAAHAAHIDAWWRDQRPDAPDLFRNELSGALQLLSEAPHVGPLYRARAADDVRRLLLSRSRAHVYYVVDRALERVAVIAIWSAVAGRPPPLP